MPMFMSLSNQADPVGTVTSEKLAHDFGTYLKLFRASSFYSLVNYVISILLNKAITHVLSDI